MPGPLITHEVVGSCMHGGVALIGPIPRPPPMPPEFMGAGPGLIKVVPSGPPRVTVFGKPVVLASDQVLISGCPFPNPATLTPPCCIKVQWTPAGRIRVMGVPVMVNPAMGLCLPGMPAPPVIQYQQVRVKGM